MSSAMEQDEGPAPQGDSTANDTQDNKMRTYMEEMGLTDMPSQDAVMKEVEAKYEEECAKLRARAERFKTEFKPPNKYEKFKHEIRMAVRNMRTRPLQGGIDIDSAEERAKIEARAHKYKGTTPEVQQRLDSEREEKEREEKRAAREAKFGKQERLGYDIRVFPQIFKDLHVDPRKIYCASSARKDIRDEEYHAVDPTKVHLFASDSPSFLKLRSPDVFRFFNTYQPKYVEWLGANSCNVFFHDEATARRALKEVSVELPTWEPLRRDLYGDENAQHKKHAHRRQRPVSEGLDISAFKWRLGKQRLVKKYTDDYGPAGTSVVVLMRLATSADVFDPEKSKKKYEAIQTLKAMYKGDDSAAGGGGAVKRERPKLRRPTFISDDKAEAPAQEEALEEEPSRVKRRRRGEADSDSDDDDDGMDEDQSGEARMEEEEDGEHEEDKGATEKKEGSGSADEGDKEADADLGEAEAGDVEELENEYADLL